jgi:deoxycytidylate deaminase
MLLTEVGPRTSLGMLLTYAQAAKRGSNCERGQVGCVLADGVGELLSVGQNGSKHPKKCQRPEEMGNCGCLHAEVRAVINLRGKLPYIAVCTLAPCERCAKVLAEAGVSHVYFEEESRVTEEGYAVFREAGITLSQIRIQATD